MGKIIEQDFGQVLKSNIEIYAKEVNEDRAIPSIYDGLKPSQRRILYWLSQNKGEKNFLGCAEIVGGVLGSFHPRGDASVYGALVRLSQPLIMAYPLIDFHGNNGSITDPPAAMRYTKAKLSKIGSSLLDGIDVPEMVEWTSNYNDTLKEPKYLLGTLGTLNLLINPQIGIGVGLASNFVCHNLEDIKKIVKFRMKNPNCRFEDLPELYPAFKKGGVIVNKKDIPNIYKTGKGAVVLRAKYHWEKNTLIVDEFPYRSDASSIKKELIKSQIDGVTEIFESNGILKIYVEPTANKEDIESALLKKTGMQSMFVVNMTATGADGKPRVWTLLELIDFYIQTQHHKVIKDAANKKNICEGKLHIAQGLSKALTDIDNVISIIRESESTIVAKVQLMNHLNIDEQQALAILDIRLGRLTHMEVTSVEQQIKNLKAQIEYEQSRIEKEELRNQEIIANLSLTYSEEDSKDVQTECLDLMQMGVDLNKVSEEAELAYNESDFSILRDDENDVKGLKLTLSPEEDYIIISSEFRGFALKGKDFEWGEYNWVDFLKLNENEKIVTILPRTTVQAKEFWAIGISDKTEKQIHNSFILSATTKRGKKLEKLKGNLVYIE